MMRLLSNRFCYDIETCSVPLMDVYETRGYLVYEIDLPGIDPADVTIHVLGDLLIIEGYRGDDETTACSARYLCMERSRRHFRRVVRFPILVDAAAGQATYDQGVVTIRFPKLKDRMIRIPIEGG
ncbi:MAG TPA: Hsp20/alpha crystallin family protein [Dissulfurispiraceae bacterium]|nr:Hsp20/alpha crystallin family protein [Dissulfurispiraceae bacterium]